MYDSKIYKVNTTFFNLAEKDVRAGFISTSYLPLENNKQLYNFILKRF